jgi:hypothetical protein
MSDPHTADLSGPESKRSIRFSPHITEVEPSPPRERNESSSDGDSLFDTQVIPDSTDESCDDSNEERTNNSMRSSRSRGQVKERDCDLDAHLELPHLDAGDGHVVSENEVVLAVGGNYNNEQQNFHGQNNFTKTVEGMHKADSEGGRSSEGVHTTAPKIEPLVVEVGQDVGEAVSSQGAASQEAASQKAVSQKSSSRLSPKFQPKRSQTRILNLPRADSFLGDSHRTQLKEAQNVQFFQQESDFFEVNKSLLQHLQSNIATPKRFGISIFFIILSLALSGTFGGDAAIDPKEDFKVGR